MRKVTMLRGNIERFDIFSWSPSQTSKLVFGALITTAWTVFFAQDGITALYGTFAQLLGSTTYWFLALTLLVVASVLLAAAGDAESTDEAFTLGGFLLQLGLVGTFIGLGAELEDTLTAGAALAINTTILANAVYISLFLPTTLWVKACEYEGEN